jgi:hypothetical protein
MKHDIKGWLAVYFGRNESASQKMWVSGWLYCLVLLSIMLSIAAEVEGHFAFLASLFMVSAPMLSRLFMLMWPRSNR